MESVERFFRYRIRTNSHSEIKLLTSVRIDYHDHFKSMERYDSNSIHSFCRLPKENVFEFIRENVKVDLPESAVIEMDAFYRLYTQSDELINVVDCRSKEEYDSCHISNAYHIVLVTKLVMI